MSLWKTFKEDMKALVPESIKIYQNDETGEEAFEIVNKPNRFVPTHIRSYENKKISIYEATNKRPEFVEKMLGEHKCLTTKKQEMLVGNSY